MAMGARCLGAVALAITAVAYFNDRWFGGFLVRRRKNRQWP